MIGEPPLVSVIIATYNWSSVLRYAVQTVLWQTFQDFELWVIGDACTDDSEEVVASFGDARIRWHNLTENSGSQAIPNNKGLEMARGGYIAYLNHDDVWHPRHLETLVAALKSQNADLAYAITSEMVPPHFRFVKGVSPSGQYPYPMFFTPSSIMHRHDMVDEIGLWKDHRQIYLPPDRDFLDRAYRAGKKFVPTNELTVFRFPSAGRLNAYVEKPSHEQAEYIQRIQSEADFLYHEMMKILLYIAPSSLPLLPRASLLPHSRPGEMIEKWRAKRGLPPKPLYDNVPQQPPLYSDIQMLRFLNRRGDVTPAQDRQQLYQKGELPVDGLFAGYGWYDIQFDPDYAVCRAAKNNAEIVVTRPSGRQRHLLLEVAPGAALEFQPFELRLIDSREQILGATQVKARQIVEFELPLSPGQGAILGLHIDEPQPNRDVEGYIPHFMVYRFAWVDAETLTARQHMTDLQAELNAKNALIDELLFYRKTSLRYYARLWRLRLRHYIPWI